MTPNTQRVAWRLQTIRALHAKGYRVLIKQNREVVIWSKSEPEKEWHCGSLKQAAIVFLKVAL